MRFKADLTLLFVALLWGSGFAVMRVAAQYDIIFLLNGSRFLLGGLIILPFIHIKQVFLPKGILPIILAGLALFSATTLQQAGLKTTTAGNTGFITILYVLIVPIVLFIGWKERPKRVVWISVVLAGIGGFLLSTNGSLRIAPGDILIFIGSFFWAIHVIIVGKFQSMLQPLVFASGQYLVCGVLNIFVGSILEHPPMQDLLAITPAILYTAVMSIAIGFTLQVIAQKHTPASEAAIILSFEAVFAALFGWIFLKEVLSAIQLAGCIIIMLAVVAVQVGVGKNRIT